MGSVFTLLLVVGISALVSAVRILKEYERGVIFRLGRLHAVRGPGIFFIIYLIGADPSLLKQPRRWLKPALGFLLGSLIMAYNLWRTARGDAPALERAGDVPAQAAPVAAE